MTVFLRRAAVAIFLVCGLLAAAVYLSRSASTDWLVRNEQWLRQAIQDSPLSAWLIAFATYFILSLVPGTSGKSIVLGWLFGFLSGVILVDCALTLAAIVSFLAGRYLLRSRVESRFPILLTRLDERMKRDGTMYLMTMRFAHLPFSLVNYGTAVGTSTSLLTFWWTTQLGLLPGTAVFVFAGTRLPTLQQLAEQGPLRLLDPLMIAALAATVVLPYTIQRVCTGRSAAHLHRGVAPLWDDNHQPSR